MRQSSRDLIGTTLGTCTLEQLLGQGGAGAVYLARQQRPAGYVAVKVLLPNVVLSSQMQGHYLARFRREADIIARLEHVNIVPIYEYGEQDGLAYLVMPYVSGGRLYDALVQRGTIPFMETIQYLHQQDEPRAPAVLLTGTRTLLGTPHYMAPEMLEGQLSDHGVDLYALGIIVYHLLSGKLPFEGGTLYALIAKHMHEFPPLLHLTHAVGIRRRPRNRRNLVEQVVWLERLELEYENLRAALQWAAAHGNEEMQLALRLSSGFLAFSTWAKESEQ